MAKRKAEIPYAARADWRAEWATRKSQWVEATWLRYMREPWRPLYAYYHKTDRVHWGILLTLTEDQDRPLGAILVAPERIPAGDKATIARWFEQYAGQLEVIPDQNPGLR